MVPRDVTRLLVTVCCLWPAMLSAHHGDAVLSAQRIDPPKIIKHVEPVYPDSAQRARIQGVVVLEATIGPDGKVRDAKVLQSIPQLDEAALAAVWQWEYTPTIIDGVARPVIMTVKVNFALSEPAAAARSSEPLVLDRDASDWTLNGTPLLDNNLRLRLQEVMQTRADKQLLVHTAATSTYASG